MKPSFPALQSGDCITEQPREGSLFHRQRAGEPIITLGFLVVLRSRRELSHQARLSAELAPELRGARGGKGAGKGDKRDKGRRPNLLICLYCLSYLPYLSLCGGDLRLLYPLIVFETRKVRKRR